MARKIVGVLRPFDMKQNFYVYEDGNKLAVTAPTLDKINETIFSLAEEYDIKQVDLVGPKQYIRGLTKRFKEAEIAKYNKNTIEINII
jgi:hypothetical protein